MFRKKKKTYSSHFDFILIGNGHQYNIIGALHDFLLSKNFEVQRIAFPLFSHEKVVKFFFKNFKSVQETVDKQYLPPPLSYILDPFESLKWIRKSNCFVIFNPYITTFFLVFRKFFIMNFMVVHWHIDFSSKRFKSKLLNRIYKSMDKYATQNCDYNIDITSKANEIRIMEYKIKTKKPTLICGVGVSEKHILKIKKSNRKEIIFIGNLREGQGLDTVIDLAALFLQKDPTMKFKIIGNGKILNSLINYADSLGVLNVNLEFLGELNEKELRDQANNAFIGLIPYVKDEKAFSYFSDPSKIKEYFCSKLIVVGTDFNHQTQLLQQLGIYFIAKNLEEFYSIIKYYQNDSIVIDEIYRRIDEYLIKQTWELKFENFLKFINHEELKKKINYT